MFIQWILQCLKLHYFNWQQLGNSNFLYLLVFSGQVLLPAPEKHAIKMRIVNFMQTSFCVVTGAWMGMRWATVGDDKTRGSGSFLGSDHGLAGHVVTCGRVGREQKEEKLACPQHWQSSILQKLQEAHLVISEWGSGEECGAWHSRAVLYSWDSWLGTADILSRMAPCLGASPETCRMFPSISVLYPLN